VADRAVSVPMNLKSGRDWSNFQPDLLNNAYTALSIDQIRQNNTCG